MRKALQVVGMVAMGVSLWACERSGGGSPTTGPATTQEQVKQHLENAGREIEQAATEASAEARPALEKAAKEARDLAHRLAEKAANETATTQPAGNAATQP